MKNRFIISLIFFLKLGLLGCHFPNNILPKELLEDSILNSFNNEDCIQIDIKSNTSKTVKDFGAIPNDGKDDSDAFQKMLNDGYDLVIEGGDYNIFKNIVIQNKKNVQIYGIGNKTRLISEPQKDSVSVLSLINCSGVLISNITFLGGADRPNFFNRAIRFGDANNRYVIITNCKFDGSGKKGFNFGIDTDPGGKYIVVSNCSFENLMGSTSGNGYGIHVKYSENVKICSNKFLGGTGRSRHAIYISAGNSRCLVIDNTIKNYEHESITLNCFTTQNPTTNNIIKNNTIVGGCDEYWASSQISIYGKCWNNLVVGNHLIKSNKIGIFISGHSGDNFNADDIANGNIISDNIIDSCSTVGIQINGAKNTIIENNKINFAGFSDSIGRGYSSIYISANLYDFSKPTSVGTILRNNEFSGVSVTRSCLFFENGYKPIPEKTIICPNNKFMKLRLADIELNGINYSNQCL